MKLPTSILSYVLYTIIAVLIVMCIYYKNAYESTYKDYIIELQSKEQLSISLESQNKEIEKLKIEAFDFKSKYQQVIESESNKVIENYSKHNVNSCVDILELIENLK